MIDGGGPTRAKIQPWLGHSSIYRDIPDLLDNLPANYPWIGPAL
jgi:hypothetical protein